MEFLKRPVENILSREGAAAIELALIAPILLLMILGVVDFGGAYSAKLRLDSAARSGVQFALQNTANITNTGGIGQVVDAASGLDPATITTTVTQFCECDDGSSIACNGTCAGGGFPRTYLTVSVQRQYPILFSYPGVSNPLPLTGRATVRVQ